MAEIRKITKNIYTKKPNLQFILKIGVRLLGTVKWGYFGQFLPLSNYSA